MPAQRPALLRTVSGSMNSTAFNNGEGQAGVLQGVNPNIEPGYWHQALELVVVCICSLLTSKRLQHGW